MRSQNPTPQRRPASVALLLLLGAVVLALTACSDSSTVEPLPAPGQQDGPVLGGTVRNLGGEPVGGVVVTAEPLVDGMAASVRARLDAVGRGGIAPANDEAQKATRDRLAVVTDAGGRFAFAGLQPGAWLLTTDARDHKAGHATATVPEPRAAALAETTFVDIALIPTGTFTGTVTRQNANGHRGTVVYCEGTSYVAVTDAAGDYVMRDVPAGSYTLVATHYGWLDQEAPGTIAAAGDLVAVAPLVLPRDANMAPVATITSPAPDTFYSQSMTPFAVAAHDPDGAIVLYEWDFEDDGTFDLTTASGAGFTHEFATAGSYRVKLRVTDDRGAIGLAVANVTVVADIHVSAAAGSDINPGTRSAPVATVTRGLDLAQAEGSVLVKVATGTYNENVTLRSGVSVTGGCDLSSWTRSIGSRSTLAAALPSIPQNGVTGATFIGLHFQAPSAVLPGNASIGLWLNGGGDLRFEDCAFGAGAGTAGLAGSPGSNGSPGANGSNGGSGAANSSVGGGGGAGGTGAAPGGAGGTGGYLGNGLAGVNGSGGASGGSAGLYATSCVAIGTNGGSGITGSVGPNGANGSGAVSTVGNISGGVWLPANGATGTAGGVGNSGGGGGGGGGGYDAGFVCSGDRGGGGGGGGAGGGGGLPGVGGGGGGASIAVLLVDCSPVFDAECRFQSAQGGNGGDGGNGGTGGAGGNRGLGGGGGGEAGDGGNGGFGGQGGPGGGGQGGAGGPSICLYKSGASAPVLLGSPSMAVGAPGAGGVGGQRGGGGAAAASGPSGTAALIYPVF